ncbi:TrkH family potassium uptake protein [Lusitaniella coriacea LEGE 07157]|uniref:TrkH family potassium uptake protein n=1 Tax=Lusitaniella coriacea LEGE 07157 TaxID=945747 RepID=A0A8J7E0E6_9CYAN|nr:TrkH family potassium uptake protein [Lusitaniella coriacea]MBE9119017.1 TrkH family potassium uptake protein [Lusitaniella coriacea LEGE 07157]
MTLTSSKTGRYGQFLRRRYRAILSYTGLGIAIAGLFILSPLLALIFYPEEINIAWGFLLPGAILSLVGVILWRSLTPSSTESLTWQEGTVIVLLTWLFAIFAGTFPFIGIGGLNFTQAVFESTSGWTTTGLSVVDVTQASRLILLYRSIIELVGGAGFAIITLSTITGIAGAGLTLAEGRTDQLVPNVRRSAKLVLGIYTGYVAVGTIGLRLAGMGWFDAINQAFAALSTGGFSTRTNSIGYWDSPSVEAVTIVLMLFGTLNFVTSYLLLKGKFKAVTRNGEVRLLALMIPVCALILFLGVASGLYPSLGKAVRVAIFETITAISTTGFSTVGYGDWNSVGWFVLIVLMLIGGGSGATAGGIKQLRIYILYRALVREMRRMLLPESAITEADLWQRDRRSFLQDSQILTVSMFIFLYLIFWGVGTLILTAYGYSLPESLFEYASAIGTVGLSVGVTSADAPSGLLWAEVVGMFLGRLELFAVFVGGVRLLRDIPSLFK